ncbi:MAG: NAD(P)/FAD-dependent oxidoreductase [Deltaproteobacteria bacterium]|nr:MAG: NAD(P)/FAD-dependent oxidoreductase [Deltaproteobacteria bacterium]
MTSRATRRERTRGAIDATYDAIVIGAGPGGLTAGTLLARAGKRVLMLDQHYVPGGNATLFKRKHWEFDVGLHYIGECQEDGVMTRLLAACGVDDLEMRPMDDDIEQLTFPDFDFAIPRDKAVFEARLLARFPGEARGIRRYIRFLNQCDRVVRADQRGNAIQRAVAIARSPLVVRWHQRPLGEFLDTCTDNLQLRAVLTAQNGTYAVAPDRISSVLHAGLANHYHRAGAFYPAGGGQKLSDRLAEEFEAAGGQLRLSSSVDKVLVEDGRAVGVRFTNKHLGTCDVRAPIVVSNADLKRTVADLVGVEHFPASWTERVLDFEMALPLFVVYLGLDLPPEQLPYGNSNRWLFDRYDFTDDYRRMVDGEMPEDPFIYVSTASLKDPHNPGVAPDGHSNVEIMTMVPSDLSFWGVTPEMMRDGSYKTSETYQARKREIEASLIAQFEKIVPGATARIVHRESATPMTHSRYVRSSEGSCYGFAAIPEQFLGRRPGARSKLPGLYFAGTNCRAGHGIVGAMTSGAQAADAILGGGLFRKVMRGEVAEGSRWSRAVGGLSAAVA